jgi:hypothetical protein
MNLVSDYNKRAVRKQGKGAEEENAQKTWKFWIGSFKILASKW